VYFLIPHRIVAGITFESTKGGREREWVVEAAEEEKENLRYKRHAAACSEI
jgi:hypothetical protein